MSFCAMCSYRSPCRCSSPPLHPLPRRLLLRFLLRRLEHVAVDRATDVDREALQDKGASPYVDARLKESTHCWHNPNDTWTLRLLNKFARAKVLPGLSISSACHSLANGLNLRMRRSSLAEPRLTAASLLCRARSLQDDIRSRVLPRGLGQEDSRSNMNSTTTVCSESWHMSNKVISTSSQPRDRQRKGFCRWPGSVWASNFLKPGDIRVTGEQ